MDENDNQFNQNSFNNQNNTADLHSNQSLAGVQNLNNVEQNSNLNANQYQEPTYQQSLQQISQENFKRQSESPSLQENETIYQTNKFSDNGKTNQKGNKKIIFIALALIIAIIALVIVAITFGKNNKSNNGNNQQLESNSIIIKNSEGLYGIYNTNGQQVANFNYKYISPFLNNTAKVENQNGEVGIINNKGKMTIDFGKYKFIENEGYLYKVIDDNYEKYLLNGDGKILYKLDDAEVISSSFPKEIVIVEKNKAIDVLDYEGNSLIKLDGYADYKFYENKQNYTTLFYNNISYIIDIYSRKIVYKENSSTPYCVSSVNSLDNSKFVLSECEKPKQFKYMNGDSKLFEVNDCSNLFFEYNDPNLICAQDYRRYIVDEKGNNGIETYKSSISYIDGKNYIDEGGTKNTEFYIDGKLSKSVKCTKPYTTATKKDKIYILKNICSENKNTYTYYDNFGNKKFATDFKIAKKFDKNGNAIVSLDGNKEYMINLKGNKQSNEYDSINYIDDFTPIYIYIAKNGTTSIVLNNKGKELMSTEGTINVYDNYFTETTGNKVVYYTLEGKKFFE